MLVCSLVLPAASGATRRGPSKKAVVKTEDEDMAGPSASEPAAASQQDEDVDTVAAVLSSGVDLTDDAAAPLVDRLAGKLSSPSVSNDNHCCFKISKVTVSHHAFKHRC